MVEDKHSLLMRQAVNLALQGKGVTKTNPCVGAVIVKDSIVVGKGWHEGYGKEHAEINALNDAGAKAVDAELYVTLEPCVTYRKTPPCIEAIIKAEIKRVWIGALDPNLEHTGRSLPILKAAGIEVKVGVNEVGCAELIEDFYKFARLGLPYVKLKVAQSLDGKIATVTGESRWISSQESRFQGHLLRSQSDAVAVGIGTVLSDNPHLGVRELAVSRQPLKVVFDSKARMPLVSNLVLEAEKESNLIVVVAKIAPQAKIEELKSLGVNVVVAGNDQVDLIEALQKLAKDYQIMNLLLEGGSSLSGSFLKVKLVDEICFFVAPILIGEEGKSSIGGLGIKALKEAIRLNRLTSKKIGQDYVFCGKLSDYATKILELKNNFLE
jgi:riboflavin biosynthesis protein RibD